MPKIPEHFSSDLWTLLKNMIQVNAKKRPTCDELMEHPIFRKRSQKYFPEFEEEGYDDGYAGRSNLLKTIRIPKNFMHLSSRLPKKNYDSSLDGGFLSGEKGERRRPGAGGANFKNGYHNTMGKKRSIEAATTNDNTIAPNLDGSIGQSSIEGGVLKLPNIKGQNSPTALQ